MLLFHERVEIGALRVKTSRQREESKQTKPIHDAESNRAPTGELGLGLSRLCS